MVLKIAMLQTLSPELRDRVLPLVPEGFVLDVTRSTDLPDLLEVIGDADYAVAFGMSVPEEALRAAKRLRLLHRWGVGVDGVPLDTCGELGVVVAKCTGSNARPVAEFAVGAMLACSRSLIVADRSTKEGQWLKKQVWMRNTMLAGRTVGLVGFGAIARKVAQLLSGFGCDVLYTKRTRLPEDEEAALGVRFAAMDAILEADIVSLHCPLNDRTRNMIGAAELDRMKPHAILVNTARGGLVDEDALATALRTGKIRAAAIDVFEREPVDADNPLLGLDNVILSPHIAANAFDNIDNEIRHWMTNIQKHSNGEAIDPQDIVG
ncbi:MAG: 2-hydroxyacid dehydrogenase [Aquamicrobium sp.]|uniref:2-hydroxyacid dehydrogenase n=1 Tax=Aquamicrobium sp. TaxID=1872579 RepID=UPI00349EE5E8|nr:2-hydroxyacid dehydrogenase [Aquamicrobium sp.]